MYGIQSIVLNHAVYLCVCVCVCVYVCVYSGRGVLLTTHPF